MSSTPTAPVLPPNRKFVALCGAGAFVLLAGLALPRLLVDSPNPDTKSPFSESRSEKAKPAPREALAKEFDTPKTQEAPNMTGVLVRLMVGTFVVLVLCGGTAWGIARWVRAQQKNLDSGPLKLVATLPVGRSVAVHLVRIGDQQILVGTDAGGLRSMLPLGDSFEDTLEGRQIQEAHGIAVPRALTP